MYYMFFFFAFAFALFEVEKKWDLILTTNLEYDEVLTVSVVYVTLQDLNNRKNQ